MHLVVDIDQTLYPLLRAISTLPGGERVSEEECWHWNSLENMCQRPAWELIEEAIDPEVALQVGLYQGASQAIKNLAEENIDIAFATHRDRQYKDWTEVLLRDSGLDNFPLFIGDLLQKEEFLFADGLLVDDAPHVLRSASKKGIRATTLAHLYNLEITEKYALPRGNNWSELEAIARSELALKER